MKSRKHIAAELTGMSKLAREHMRLWIAVLAGAASFFLLPQHWSLVSRILASWNCGVALFFILIYWWMRSLNAEQICRKFIEEDETAPVILVICIVAALLSLVAIVDLLSTLKETSGTDRVAHIGLAAVTVLNSWALVPTMFTLHYADMFYSLPADQRPLQFPHTPEPVFGDFAYFSFTIAAACQTADVSTTNRSIRKVVAAHSVISFLFNAAILGFAINVTAGLIGGN
jgi:uncharacterized membrane protein